jgi:hypothetical protein
MRKARGDYVVSRILKKKMPLSHCIKYLLLIFNKRTTSCAFLPTNFLCYLLILKNDWERESGSSAVSSRFLHVFSAEKTSKNGEQLLSSIEEL